MNTSLFNKIFNALEKEVNAIGFTLEISLEERERGDFIWHGRCHYPEKLISIYIKNISSNEQLLFVLGHELRHAQHHIFNLYKQLRDFGPTFREEEIKMTRIKIPKLRRKKAQILTDRILNKNILNIAHLCELDCDSFSYRKLKSFGVKIKPTYTSYSNNVIFRTKQLWHNYYLSP